MAITATLTSKGQLTVPKAVREELHLETGAQIIFIKDPSAPATYRLVPRTARLEEAFSLADSWTAPDTTPLTGEELNEAIAEAASAHALGERDHAW